MNPNGTAATHRKTSDRMSIVAPHKHTHAIYKPNWICQKVVGGVVAWRAAVAAGVYGVVGNSYG